MCVCITESLFCIPETNTTLQINYISIIFFKKNLHIKTILEVRTFCSQKMRTGCYENRAIRKQKRLYCN